MSFKSCRNFASINITVNPPILPVIYTNISELFSKFDTCHRQVYASNVYPHVNCGVDVEKCGVDSKDLNKSSLLREATPHLRKSDN